MQAYDLKDFPQSENFAIKKEVTSNLYKIINKASKNKPMDIRFLSEKDAEVYLYGYLKGRFGEPTPKPKKVDPKLEPIPEVTKFTGFIKVNGLLMKVTDPEAQEYIKELNKKEEKEIELTKIRNKNKTR